MAMKIGGERDAQKLLVKNWRGFFKEAGIGQAVAQQRLLATADRILTAAEDLSGQGCAGAEKILPVIRAHHQRLKLLRWEDRLPR